MRLKRMPSVRWGASQRGCDVGHLAVAQQSESHRTRMRSRAQTEAVCLV